MENLLSEASIASIASSLVEIEERVEYKLDSQDIRNLLTNEAEQIHDILFSMKRMRNQD